MNVRKPLAALSLVAAVASAVLAGCAAKKADAMSPEVSKARMIELVDRTIEELHVSGWHELDGGAYIQQCHLERGGSGVNYAYDAMGPASSDPNGDLQVVKTFREKSGLATKEASLTNPNERTLRLYGIGGDVKGINFYVDTEAMSIGAESICVPGDHHELVSGHATDVGGH